MFAIIVISLRHLLHTRKGSVSGVVCTFWSACSCARVYFRPVVLLCISFFVYCTQYSEHLIFLTHGSINFPVHQHQIHHSPLTGVTAGTESLLTADKAHRPRDKYIIHGESPLRLPSRCTVLNNTTKTGTQD